MKKYGERGTRIFSDKPKVPKKKKDNISLKDITVDIDKLSSMLKQPENNKTIDSMNDEDFEEMFYNLPSPNPAFKPIDKFNDSIIFEKDDIYQIQIITPIHNQNDLSHKEFGHIKLKRVIINPMIQEVILKDMILIEYENFSELHPKNNIILKIKNIDN